MAFSEDEREEGIYITVLFQQSCCLAKIILQSNLVIRTQASHSLDRKEVFRCFDPSQSWEVPHTQKEMPPCQLPFHHARFILPGREGHCGEAGRCPMIHRHMLPNWRSAQHKLIPKAHSWACVGFFIENYKCAKTREHVNHSWDRRGCPCLGFGLLKGHPHPELEET